MDSPGGGGSSGFGDCGAGGRGVAASVVMGVEVAAVVVATMAVVLVCPLTLYRPSTTVLIHFVLKLIFPKKIKD